MNSKEQSLVDVNTASKKALTGISGIGPSLAQKIIDGRPYARLSELTRVSGISQTRLAQLLPHLTLTSEPSPSAIATKEPALPEPGKTPAQEKPITRIGGTEAFVFFEDENEMHDALLIIMAGLLLGLLILILRPSDK